ncbi:HNH endonuclease signature motif containing protein [Amycolatopsis keratiniphila]|uniref:HNH endonuclease n=1 Tax=Amycolatopsis keratiniphila subsp. keratiniphila TaxID=227715 RepID=A0A1W2LMF2_9PSEU|nr:HNH endonuclease signature motif containing protein [Amycolatopsis keratiniphila]OLZ48838.1 HNH endonuclease [Amycolatopsis keratiniphila subsp. nogabecina]ONF64191.1 HNH endonuclease [Amycolatopsis keratiniphila subsp. keratiniphila]SDU33628.1 HNH endonuclease [Amycolatopsis keratiniphila]
MPETTIPELPQELWRAGKVELAHGVTHLLQVMRVASASLGKHLAEIESRGAEDLFGHGSAASWFAEVARISRGDAQDMVNRALALNATSGVGGEGAVFAPATAAAAEDGALGEQHIDLILEILRKIPSDVPVEDRAGAEKILANLARDAGPKQIAEAGADLLAHLDPDGNEPKDPEPAPPRREVFVERRKDGFWKLSGLLDPETGARTAAALDAYAAKRPVDEFGQADHRTLPQRRGDAWAELLDLAIACPDQPATSGYRTLVHVTVGLDDLKTGLGTACLDFVGRISAREARLAACDCLMIPVVLGTCGEPLDVGRMKRFVTPGQRRALNIRDGGCAFPGCHRAPKHCHAHHIRHWADGGPTDLRNLVLLCSFHHRLIHHGDWQVRMAPEGRPEFVPPQYLDPLQVPRRNTLHRVVT